MLDARACAPNQVQFLTFSEGAVYGASAGATACGQCVPGRHGNWRIHGAEPFAVGASVQQCSMTDTAGLQCSALNFPEPQRSPAYSCALNEYCDDAGSCRAMKESPLYNQVCGSGAMCGPGLHCLAGRCRICARDHPQFRYRGPFGVRVLSSRLVMSKSSAAWWSRPHVFLLYVCNFSAIAHRHAGRMRRRRVPTQSAELCSPNSRYHFCFAVESRVEGFISYAA
jgi:hypothetical protein